MQKLRTPKYEQQFDREMKTIHPDFFKVDEFISGAEWVLARDPTSGFQIADSAVWCLPLRAVLEMPSVMIFYSFDATTVWFLSIKAFDAVADGDG